MKSVQTMNHLPYILKFVKGWQRTCGPTVVVGVDERCSSSQLVLREPSALLSPSKKTLNLRKPKKYIKGKFFMLNKNNITKDIYFSHATSNATIGF